jgi:hypothetical protein
MGLIDEMTFKVDDLLFSSLPKGIFEALFSFDILHLSTHTIVPGASLF